MRRETGWAGGDARERPVFPARSAGLPWGSPGRRRRSGPVRSGVCARGAAGPAAVRAAHRAGARRGPVPGGRGASHWLLPGGQRGLSAAAPGARRPHQGHRRLAACPETWPAVPPAISRRPGTPARCLAARAWRRPASAAGARTVSRLMPATGSGRDTVPGPAPDDRPAPPSRAAGRGHDTGAAVTCAFTAMAGIRRGCPGHPRRCRHGLAGLALAGCQCLLPAAVSPHRPSGACPDFFESYGSSWSPVTESNRRPSPYHAYRFRPSAIVLGRITAVQTECGV